MAISSVLLLFPPPIRRCTAVLHCVSEQRQKERALISRRQALHIVVSSPAIVLARPGLAVAEDIPLFGIRKRLKKIEEEAVEVVKESEKVVEEGIAVAEKEVEAVAEEGIAAVAGIGVAGDLVQAGVVAGAEVVGVLVGVSFVNGILGPEGKKS